MEQSKTSNKSSLSSGGIVPLYYVSQEFQANDAALEYIDKNIVSPLLLLHNWPVYLVGLSVFGTLIAFIMGIIIYKKKDSPKETEENQIFIKEMK